MIKLPTPWTLGELGADVAISTSQFRGQRLAVSDDWAAHFQAAREKFELLFETLGNLGPGGVSDDSLARAYALGLGEALRYLAGPPVSDDDCRSSRMLNRWHPAC